MTRFNIGRIYTALTLLWAYLFDRSDYDYTIANSTNYGDGSLENLWQFATATEEQLAQMCLEEWRARDQLRVSPLPKNVLSFPSAA